jgi:hypothetical protein
MDVTGFLFVSLGSSTVQFHDSLGSRRASSCSEFDFSSQNADGAWECTTEKQCSGVRFAWTKGLNTKVIHKEMFAVYGGKFLSCKAVRNYEYVEKFSLGRVKVADDDRPGEEVAEIIVKRLLCCGFRRSGKAKGTSVSMLVEHMLRNKCFFQVRIYPVLRFISVSDPFTDSPSYLPRKSFPTWTLIIGKT